ncbi:Phosphate transporter [Aphelenchoides fujianensis]|nr:Phosphate transporter [Aphelenchoides fujianensis]KAI6207191.1 Phosphate transporter [Aphelenchoides fujianensis]KAI6229853.1 Phosphate transporter [Aphelenchoides fujianensis]
MDVVSTTLEVITSTVSRQEFQHSVLIFLIVGVLLAFLLGFSLGAHDVANTFGTSVGSKVLTIHQAYFLATIFETAGAILLGYNVVTTMRKSVVDTSLYVGQEREFFIAQLAVLAACSLWLLITTFLQLPVSSSHSIVGSTVGFSIALKGFVGINWGMIAGIASSWVISPVFSGLVSGFLYILVDMLVLRRRNPVKCGLRCIPFFYFFCIAFNVFTIVFQGSKIIGIEDVPLGWASIIAFLSGVLIGLAVQFVMRPYLLRYINKVDEPAPAVKTDLNGGTMTVAHEPQPHVHPHQPFSLVPSKFVHWLLPSKDRKDNERSLRLFSTIQVFTACFAGFAHGANDVANVISPIAAMLSVYLEDSVLQEKPASIWIFVFGAVSICVGLWCLGHKIIVVVGEKMSHIHPASGFTIEFGAAVTSILASKLGLPISTTHSVIGSVVTVGSLRSGGGVQWSIFRNIVFAWLVTLPVTVGMSAALTLLLKWLVM